MREKTLNEVQIDELTKFKEKKTRRIKLLKEKKIPQRERWLSQLPAVVRLGNALQTDTQLHYRLFLKWDSHEVVLATSDKNAAN